MLAVLLGAGAAALLPGLPSRHPTPTVPAPPHPSSRAGPATPSRRTGGGRPARGRVGLSVAVGVGVAVLVGGISGFALGCVGVVAAWLLTALMESPEARRRRERLEADVPLVVDLLAAALSVGQSPSAAVGQIARAVDPPMRDELESLDAWLRLGGDPVAVWRDLGAHPQLGGVGRALARAADTGASVAEAMARLADDLRGEGRAEVESRARSVGVKAAAPLGLCLLPAFVLVGVVPLVASSVALFLGR
jgi:Flp pilus assembly protein TadB